jgi:hypothetical protein
MGPAIWHAVWCRVCIVVCARLRPLHVCAQYIFYDHPGNRVDYGRQGVGWIQRNRTQPEMLHNPTYETRVGHTLPYAGYNYTNTFSGLVVYDVVSNRPRWMVRGVAQHACHSTFNPSALALHRRYFTRCTSPKPTMRCVDIRCHGWCRLLAS